MTRDRPIAVLLKSGRTHQYDACIERAFDLINPDTSPNLVTQCRLDIATAISVLDHQPDFVAPNVIKRQLEDVAARLWDAQTAIGDLAPSGWQAMLHAENLVREIKRVRERAAELAESIKPTKRSGGGRNERTEATRKRIAAEWAFDLLISHGDCTPTATRNGKYVQLATLLFEGATTQKMNLERACADVIRSRRKNFR